jgi:hypothetical protein
MCNFSFEGIEHVSNRAIVFVFLKSGRKDRESKTEKGNREHFVTLSLSIFLELTIKIVSLFGRDVEKLIGNTIKMVGYITNRRWMRISKCHFTGNI